MNHRSKDEGIMVEVQGDNMREYSYDLKAAKMT